MGQTLYEKVFDRHVVREVSPGQFQLLAGIHLLNEVSSPQAFEALRERGLPVRHPGLTFGSADHSISTGDRADDFADPMAAAQVRAMGRNMAEFGLNYFDPAQGEHGIIHVVAPERGLTQPGSVIVCGDSHTSTHGAFGAIAFGIGTSQVRDVLASQTLLMEKLKVRRIEIAGRLAPGVYRQGRGAARDPRAGRQGRRRLRLRVRRGGGGPLLDGGAHDPVQPGDRGRRALRLCQPGPHHLRLPTRPRPRAARRGLGPCGRGVGARPIRTPTPPMTTSWCCAARRSNQW